MPRQAASSDEPTRDHAHRARFLASFEFALDDFQLAGMDAIDQGHSVVVAAPTGSGKTVVAEYAVDRALAKQGKAFYTTPLKALSNQKFADFSRRWGSGKVGLLTGDNAINPEAPVVVMTTEVLRNMIYAGSAALAGLQYVVLDEVHYLQDPYRGPVWEEVIIHLPPEVDLVCLSATVSNAEELADWVGTVRGSTKAIIEEHRPVPLHNLVVLGDKRSQELLLLPTFVDGRPNPRGIALASRTDGGWKGHRRGSLFVPRRTEVVDLLGEQELLPVIYFIFSRAGCDEAVRQAQREARRLTSSRDRHAIRQIAEASTSHLSDADLEALGYGNWVAALEAGFAAHHAGMVPPFKEAVERCFLEGLVKVVFATETLALGINMPARSVVIERLSKFGGERVEPLTPGEYTQLTGRAGRRGTDEVGYGIVVWAPVVGFDQVASLAGARSYTLTSSFRPTYNMATNLVRRCTPEQAHHLLNLSFAQYRSDADIVRLETQLGRAEDELVKASEQATCARGDVLEYRRLQAAPDASAGSEAPTGIAAISKAMEGLRPGDVVMAPLRTSAGARPDGRVAVLTTSQRKKGGTSLRAITPHRKLVSLGPRDFHEPPEVVAHVPVPVPFAPKNRDFRRQVAYLLGTVQVQAPRGAHYRKERQKSRAAASHPVASCPDARAHLRAAARAERLQRQVESLKRQVKGRSESLARQFDRVRGLLESWGYVEGWALTPRGERLARIYHEQDLLVAECVERGALDGLRPAEMAAVVSFFTYEPRGPASELSGTKMPGKKVDERWRSVLAVSRSLEGDEEKAGLPVTRGGDPGFAGFAYAWAGGKPLGAVLSGGGGPRATAAGERPHLISAGDFVRNIKQLIDLLRQLGEVLPDEASGAAAQKAAELLFRGVVAASSVVTRGAPAVPDVPISSGH